jgi:hypothetical protein
MKKVFVFGTLILVLILSAVPAFAAGTSEGNPDTGVINITATTDAHFWDNATDPQAWAWNYDLWTLNVDVDCEVLVRIEWFDVYPTNDVYDLYVDDDLKGTNVAGETGSADILLEAGSHSVKVDWIYYQTDKPLIAGGSWYDITFTTIQYQCTPPTGEITKPGEGEIVFGSTLFEALYVDNDPLGVQWAVRQGTCAAGTNTVFGNVDGHHDTYSWDGHLFQAIADTSSWSPGKYCFIFNPVEGAGEPDLRLTQWFWVADGYFSGGGQAIEEIGEKQKDWYKISFGGYAADVGSYGYLGEWEVNFHNVIGDEIDKSKFHATEIAVINFYPANTDTCLAALNFTAFGEWNHIPDYKMIFRAGDFGSPGKVDTVRVELYDPDGDIVFDTHIDDFTDESSCVGSARTGLDNGNITIVMP